MYYSNRWPRHLVAVLAALIGIASAPNAWPCTSILVGRKASSDGSVMTSHTCDSHRTGSEIVVVPRQRHPLGAELMLSKRFDDDSGRMPRYGRKPTAAIPQAAETFGYLAPAYAAMNERQVAIGESTFEGRKELVSDEGLIDCETLTRLMLARAATAREAIRMGGELIEKYGWCDVGEALTIADPREVWVMEIVGPGAGEVGAVWAAQRVPDDHISVVANAARIGEVDLAQPEFFMASANLRKVAEQRGYWKPESGQRFRFYEAYNPEGRVSVAATRREWRVLSLLAPSLNLQPNSNVFPFSVKPEKPVAPARIMELFRDTFEGTEFDMVKDLTVVDATGKTVKSPLANPFMPYEMNKMLRLNGAWGWRCERPMARWYCMYATVTQSRGQLPDPVGGLVWFGYANPAMTTYVPLYAGISDLPDEYKADGRTTGFSRDSAWWAFQRVATISAHRWGEMRRDVSEVRDPLQAKLLAAQPKVAAKARRLLADDPAAARAYLTRTSRAACLEAIAAYWQLGDRLWTKYDEKW
jgi:dipeptidase